MAVDFDPTVLSYADVLSLIWESHHPLKNFGSRQYRHAIWYHNDDQKTKAEASRESIAEKLSVPVDSIQTVLEPAGTFTYAEDYHQKYSLRGHRQISNDLANLFSNHIAFSDSAVMTRLNGWFGNGNSDLAPMFRQTITSFGLPEELEGRVLAEIR